MANLTGIQVLNRSAFSNISETSDSTLYFVEDGEIVTLVTSGVITLSDNTIYRITPSSAVTFSLPTISDATVLHQIMVQVNLSTVYTITLGTTYYFNKTAPNMSATGKYNLIYEYDPALSAWVVGCISKGAAS